MVCVQAARETPPYNWLLLGLFTLAEAYLLGTVSSYYETQIVLQALILTGVVKYMYFFLKFFVLLTCTDNVLV